MPLTTDYTWRQTDDEVFIDVALKSSTLTGGDVDICDVFVKVNQSPYLLTLDLYAAIDLNSVVVTIDRNTRRVSISMRKVTCIVWPSIELTKPEGSDSTTSPIDMAAFSAALVVRRNESIAARSRYNEEVRLRTLNVRRERDKSALNAQMDVERQHREALENAQADEKRRAQVSSLRGYTVFMRFPLFVATTTTTTKTHITPYFPLPSAPSLHSPQEAVFDTFKAINKSEENLSPTPSTVISSLVTSTIMPPTTTATTATTTATATTTSVVHNTPLPSVSLKAPTSASTISTSIFTHDDIANHDADISALPPPRQCGKAPPIIFTPRAFPTPLRESRAKEEDDWLAKNYVKIKETRDAGKQPGPVSFIEKDGIWLRSKAEDFARVGDWDSACNAFSAAIGASLPDAALFLNRAACHLRKYRASMCVDDCNLALDLLLVVPPNPDTTQGAAAQNNISTTEWLSRIVALGASRGAKNEKSMALTLKALSRRFSGFALQGKFNASLNDLTACCLLAGEDTETGAYFNTCRERNTLLATIETLKTNADALFMQGGEGNSDGALELYAEALSLEPSYAVCYLNRAALFLSKDLYTECISDCDRVLSLLDAAHPSSSPEDPLYIVPLSGSELSSACRIRATARREEAVRKRVEAVTTTAAAAVAALAADIIATSS
jgi:hypothetical protein